MGECFMTSRGGSGEVENVLDNVPVVAGVCSLLTKVTTSSGYPIDNCYVCCNDGGTWYNYHTNEKGYALFSVNSGQVNIAAWNYSVAQGWTILDQTPSSSGTIDAPVGTKNQVNIALTDIENRVITFTENKSNFKILGVNKINKIQMIGGGSGGGSIYYKFNNTLNAWFNNAIASSSSYKLYNNSGSVLIGANGGGGGAYNEVSNYAIEPIVYNVIIGAGGAMASSGGTTSAFGISAVGGYANGKGGGSGTYRGGNGGTYALYSNLNTTTGSCTYNYNFVMSKSSIYGDDAYTTSKPPMTSILSHTNSTNANYSSLLPNHGGGGSAGLANIYFQFYVGKSFTASNGEEVYVYYCIGINNYSMEVRNDTWSNGRYGITGGGGYKATGSGFSSYDVELATNGGGGIGFAPTKLYNTVYGNGYTESSYNFTTSSYTYTYNNNFYAGGPGKVIITL